MSVTYIHYGADKFEKEKFKPIKNCDCWSKPFGGFWASRDGDEDGWRTWCEDQDFYPEKLEHSFIFTIKPSANVIEIANEEDILKLPQWKPVAGSIKYCRSFYPDFEECLRKGIDAIEITNINEAYMGLYGWDCNSILIMNPDIVEVA